MTRRRNRPVAIYVLAGVVTLGCLYLVFELGRYASGYSLLDHRQDRATLADQLAEERAASDELRRQVAILETAGEVDRATYAQVKSTLSDLQAQIQAQEEELVFYRGIVSPQDNATGLRIQSLEVLQSDGEGRYLVSLLLVQSISQTRKVSGAVQLSIEGVQDGQTTSLDVADLVVPGESYDTAYEFRYFQGLEAEVALPIGFEPQRITVEISPKEARAERINQSFEWSQVADERKSE
jgi:hypothetical protein